MGGGEGEDGAAKSDEHPESIGLPRKLWKMMIALVSFSYNFAL